VSEQGATTASVSDVPLKGLKDVHNDSSPPSLYMSSGSSASWSTGLAPYSRGGMFYNGSAIAVKPCGCKEVSSRS